MTYRQAMAQETKKKILNTAMKLFYQDGFDNVTVADIMNEAQISRSSFYVYFNDKYDLLGTSLTERMDELYSESYNDIMSSPDNASLSSIKKLELFALSVPHLFMGLGPEITRIAYECTLKDSSYTVDLNRTYFKIIHELLDQCFAEGLINDSFTYDEIFDILTMLGHAISYNWTLKGGVDQINEKDSLITKFIRQISK